MTYIVSPHVYSALYTYFSRFLPTELERNIHDHCQPLAVPGPSGIVLDMYRYHVNRPDIYIHTVSAEQSWLHRVLTECMAPCRAHDDECRNASCPCLFRFFFPYTKPHSITSRTPTHLSSADVDPLSSPFIAIF